MEKKQKLCSLGEKRLAHLKKVPRGDSAVDAWMGSDGEMLGQIMQSL